MAEIVILGAGAAGLFSSWLLKQYGFNSIVLERRPYPGGLARSFMWNGFACDFAAHRLFTSDEWVLQQLLKLVPMGRHIRRSEIYLQGTWYQDPLYPTELAQRVTNRERINLLHDYVFRERNLPENSFKNYVIKRYGKALYHLFFQPYTEKLFGIPGDEVSVEWARKKVRLANPLDKLREESKIKFDYFYYPIEGGYGAIVNHIYDDIKDQVVLNATVNDMQLSKNRIETITYDLNGQSHTIPSEKVISTLPMTITGRLLNFELPLSFKQVTAVYLNLSLPNLSDLHWIYFIDSDISINRLVEFKNLSHRDTPPDRTVICAEVTQELENPAERVINDLVKVGLIRREDVLDSMIHQEPYAYPVYNLEYVTTLNLAREKLGGITNLFAVGRSAEFVHRELDDIYSTSHAVVVGIVKEHEETREPLHQLPTAENKKMKITVNAVILTYNKYDDTSECLDSLLATEGVNIEVTVVDNGSTDGTPEKIRNDYPSVKIIENDDNLGVPAGYNVGFAHALKRGAEFILMLNNDTTVSKNMVAQLMDFAGSKPEAGVIMPKVLLYQERDRVWSSGGRYRKFPPAILMTDRRRGASETLRSIEYAPSCGLLIRREVFETAGFFDPGYFFLYDDWDFSERVRAHGFEIWFVPSAEMWHKVSRTTGGPKSPLFWYNNGAGTVRFYRRHANPFWPSFLIHISYIISREFIIKGNWAYWSDFLSGVRDGLKKPLGSIPSPGINQIKHG